MSKRKRKREEAAAAAATPDAPDATDATAGSVEEPLSPRRLLPVDVQQKEFRLAFRGYNEQDVDVFLDGVTEELARLHEENKRLIEQIEEGSGPGSTAGALIQDAQRRAEDIVREAREQAGALLSGAVEPGSGSTAEDIRPFLVREREFLQGLAGLIQQHAEAVKREAQQVRESAAEATPRPSAAYAPEATSYVPRHASDPAPPASLPVVPEPADAAPPATTGATVAAGDAWGPEPQADAWAEAPEPEPAEAEPAEAPLPYVPAATEIPGPPPMATTEFEQAAPPAETAEPDPGRTQSWRAPSEPEWEEAVELPLEDEGGDRFTPEAPPGQDAQQAAFDSEGGGEASWTNPFLETGGPGPAPAAPVAPQPADLEGLEDDLRPDPISLSAPAPEPESEDAGQGAKPSGLPRDESDEADREESDRSLRELFWGEE